MKLELNYLKSVLLSQLLIESNEGLKHTPFFKQQLKQAINKCNTECERVYNKHYDEIYSNSPEMATNVLNKLDDLMTKLTTSTIDELIMIDAVIDKYNENKEWFMQHANAEFLRLE